MARKTVHSDSAPQAIGPYSQAVQADAGKMIFLSGQIPLDPKTMELVQGDAAVQAERVMQNLKAVLAAAGADFSHVVRCTIFLIDLGDFSKVNEVYGRFFTGAPPARVTVQVSALPRGAKVEIDAIAVL
ncbi:RidA family protein [Stigmatella erecta]|uniref:2-iminobutanoate/2-iminopropanoate deaminase n=1 Tax=Stigmatella erecta TaxID=83460 RepID=A0A1I0K7X4_9BACT|nr:RidA family protein [Stigmatella erecta]SEU19762.1 2-iminobutanoate/2-iminopropanoate deaminase [Stigmatella erecta]